MFVIRSKEAHRPGPPFKDQSEQYTYYVAGDMIIGVGSDVVGAARFATKQLATNARKRLGLSRMIVVSVERAQIDARMLEHRYVMPQYGSDTRCLRCGATHD
jgi:hypothetical protein